MAKPCAVVVHLHVAWWVYPYLQSVALFARLVDMEPDMQKVGYWVEKGITAEVEIVESVAVQV